MNKEDRAKFFNYLIENYFSNDVGQVERLTGYTKAQIEGWRKGATKPQDPTVDQLIRHAVNPRFKTIAEFEPFHVSSDDSNIRGVLRKVLGEYNGPGIYSFYDAMGSILYIGKAEELLNEMCQTLRRDIAINFPTNIQNTLKDRIKKNSSLRRQKPYEVVRYISAYYVGETHVIDYPKHVESLILRIAKPPLNTNEGELKSGMRTRTNARRKKRT